MGRRVQLGQIDRKNEPIRKFQSGRMAGYAESFRLKNRGTIKLAITPQFKSHFCDGMDVH